MVVVDRVDQRMNTKSDLTSSIVWIDRGEQTNNHGVVRAHERRYKRELGLELDSSYLP